MPEELYAGYTGIRDKATAGYAGALRRNPRSSPVWTCRHTHKSPVTAHTCAEAELERRVQGEREVIVLRRCEPCDRWWPDGDGAGCPVCSVPMERVKLVVLERSRVS